MLTELVAMRKLLTKTLWFQKVGSMAFDEDGDLELSDILFVAALTVSDDEATTLQLGFAFTTAINDTATQRTYGGAQEYAVALCDYLINQHTTVN